MAKPTWLFVVGSYRTGSTSQYLLAEALVQRTNSGIGIGYHTESKLVEYDKTEDARYIVCKVFIFLPETSEQGRRFLEGGRLKAIGTVRDPRDIIVSMRERSKDLHNVAWNFEQTVTQDFPIWLGQFDRWAQLGPQVTLVTRFEDMILDLEKEVRRIAQHLDIQVTQEVALQIARDFSLPAQIRRKQRFLARKNQVEGREHPVLPSIPGWKFGTAGHWKMWLLPAEALLVQKHAQDYMQRWGYLP